MSEDRTAETKDPRSFQDRVFARFDTIEGRLSSVEIRIGKLEDRQYDTKPIWEQALAAIAETNRVMFAGFDEFRRQLESINARLDSMDVRFDSMFAKFEALSDKVESGSDILHTDLENGLRGVERKIDVLNKNILDLQADQRYVDSRLEKIESQAKPS
jgi:chromosome segregation ATPase